MVSVAGHQCQFKVDYAKPTRLYSDIARIADFGQVGWLQVDANDWYMGPLPRCGHVHYDNVVGAKQDGSVFNCSATANYPPLMCQVLSHAHLRQLAQQSKCAWRGGGTASSRILSEGLSYSSSTTPPPGDFGPTRTLSWAAVPWRGRRR